MNIRNKVLAEVFALAMFAGLSSGCVEDDVVASMAAEDQTTVASVPTFAEVSEAVPLEATDAAVVKNALAQWSQSATRRGDGGLFRNRHAQMEFVAAVAPSLDGAQLTKLVDLLVSRREAHRETMKGRSRGHHREGDFAKTLTEELELTAEQQKAMKALHEEKRSEMHARRDAFHAGKLTKDELRAAIKDEHEAAREKLATILTPAQLTKLQGLHDARRERHVERRIERVGDHVDEYAAWLDALVGLSESQALQVKNALDAFASAQKSVWESLQSDSPRREHVHEKMIDAHEALEAALKEILTDEQWKRLEIVRPLILPGPHRA